MASIKALAVNETSNKGFLRDMITGETYRFVGVWSTRGSYVVAFIMMFVFVS